MRDLTKNSAESEKAIEIYLVNRVKSLGGLCLKYTNPNASGYPDRLIIVKGLPDIWVELKSRGKQPSALQSRRIFELRDRGRMVYVCDSREKVDEIIGYIRHKLNKLNNEISTTPISAESD